MKTKTAELTGAAKHTPGPWGLVLFPRTHPRDTRPPLFLVSRDRGDGFRECLREDGVATVHNHDSRYLYTSEDAARAAIAKATGG